MMNKELVTVVWYANYVRMIKIVLVVKMEAVKIKKNVKTISAVNRILIRVATNVRFFLVRTVFYIN